MQLLAVAARPRPGRGPGRASAPGARPEAAPRPGPVVALEVAQGRTTLGTITIALDPDKAPDHGRATS